MAMYTINKPISVINLPPQLPPQLQAQLQAVTHLVTHSGIVGLIHSTVGSGRSGTTQGHSVHSQPHLQIRPLRIQAASRMQHHQSSHLHRAQVIRP